MDKNNSLLFCVVIFICFISGASSHYIKDSQDPQLTVNLYYETLCPDCKQFTAKQLCPAWESIGEYFKIDFVPYGNAKTNVSKETGEIEIICQHGPEECDGNRVQSCALKYLSYIQSTKFICCMEASPNFQTAGKECSKTLGIDYNPIRKCADSQEGNKLHYLNGLKTDKLTPEHTWVPWILINNVYNKEEMEQSEGDLIGVICKHLSDPKPRQCNEVF